MHLVIIGNGVAGITTARWVRKRSDMRITVISAETDYHFSRTALMYIYMGHMRFEHTKPYPDDFWAKNRIELVRGFVTQIDTDHKRLLLEDGREIFYDKLVVATGSKPNKFGWPGQDLPGVQGLYSLQDLELLERNTANISKAVIVGGGLIGVELAEMLQSRNIPVTFLVREKYFYDIILPQAEAKLISRHILEHGIDLRLATELKEILPGKDGRVRAVITHRDEEIPCQFVGLTVGVHPNIDVVRHSKIETQRGVLVNDYLETNIPDVYAAGDCAEIKVEGPGARNRIEQLWYTGRLQGEALARILCGERKKYDRGIWFNSAKFFDLEYQTYGQVSNVPRETEGSFYWEHADGKHCLRIAFEKPGQAVIGMNAIGLRLRHRVCEQWIREQRPLDFVIRNLAAAHFDPEFYRRYEAEILRAYQESAAQREQVSEAGKRQINASA
ncbi:MAG: NAD(P)/FAD-dependent oxidoreductase [Calditrichaeota bacterium]|nr:MAG: NAD(P)/FAD-dependent oxidoreductase [Calditrichota bacterium]